MYKWIFGGSILVGGFILWGGINEGEAAMGAALGACVGLFLSVFLGMAWAILRLERLQKIDPDVVSDALSSLLLRTRR